VTDQQALRIAFVPGVTLRKWTMRWAERRPGSPLEVIPTSESEILGLLRGSGVDLAFVRLPIERDGLSVIRLYGEVPVVVVSRDDELAGEESVALATVSGAVTRPESAKDAVELVAAGVGRVVLPHSLARMTARKDVVAIPVTGAPETDIALVWVAEATTPDIEEFIGIVRGRTAASSRAVPTPPSAKHRASADRDRPKPQARGSRQQGRRRQGR
jgi:DNA-binding transcriptional LysR family regulator